MALFSRKQKNEAAKPEVAAPAAVKSTAASTRATLSDVLRTPRITEKGSMHMSIGVYTFDVAEDATKNAIAHAVYEMYKVRPRAIRIVTIPRKTRRNSRTGKRGITRGGKKAYVYLKKGESITLT